MTMSVWTLNNQELFDESGTPLLHLRLLHLDGLQGREGEGNGDKRERERERERKDGYRNIISYHLPPPPFLRMVRWCIRQT